MKRTAFTCMCASAYCTLLLAILLLLAACGGGYSSPGSSPNPTPTKSGYSIVTLIDREIELVSTAMHSLLAP